MGTGDTVGGEVHARKRKHEGKKENKAKKGKPALQRCRGTCSRFGTEAHWPK